MKMYSESKSPDSLPGGDHQTAIDELHYTGPNDEISLVELWQVIFAQKKYVVLITLLAMLLAAAYILLSEPLYRAQTQLLPPEQQDISELRIDYRGTKQFSFSIESYTPDLVFQMFLKDFNSKRLRREFFDDQQLANYYLAGKQHTYVHIERTFDNRFNTSLQVQNEEQGVSFKVASFEYSDPELAAQWLNQYVAFVNEYTRDRIFDDVNFMIQTEIKQVRYQLDSQLKLAEQERHDEIKHLSEALRVAKTLDIEGMSGLAVSLDKEQASIEVKTTEVPLYMRGIRALKSEIEVLESRKSDEAFAIGLRNLQQKLGYLANVSIDRDAISVVTIDTAATIPYSAIKPRKMLIAFLATALGLVIGVFLAFVVGTSTKTPRED